MSRTVKGGKAPGYDYWSKRPLSGSSPSPYAKKLTHKIERQQNKKLSKTERE